MRVAGRRAGPDLVAMTALAILTQGPRHAYDLHRFIIDTHKDYVTGLPRSLYHAIGRLHGGELVAPVETTREGRRPERTVYAITDRGRAELSTRLRRLLAEVGRDTTPFVAAVSLMGGLPSTEVEGALRDRSAVLRERVEAADRVIDELVDAGLPRIVLLEVEYERSREAAELEWVDRLVDDLRCGRIAWEVPPLNE